MIEKRKQDLAIMMTEDKLIFLNKTRGALCGTAYLGEIKIITISISLLKRKKETCRTIKIIWVQKNGLNSL